MCFSQHDSTWKMVGLGKFTDLGLDVDFADLWQGKMGGRKLMKSIGNHEAAKYFRDLVQKAILDRGRNAPPLSSDSLFETAETSLLPALHAPAR